MQRARLRAACGWLSANSRNDTADSFPMVGKSVAMVRPCASIGRIAMTDTHVLVLGKSGSGKELVIIALRCCCISGNFEAYWRQRATATSMSRTPPACWMWKDLLGT